ncbi:MAG: hypothetical protein H7222_18130 [Methylotenera sp.]|nr:hypothetical protein [Oligoflexia bacterium]
MVIHRHLFIGLMPALAVTVASAITGIGGCAIRSAQADDAAPAGHQPNTDQTAFVVKEKISELEWTNKAKVVHHAKAPGTGTGNEDDQFAAVLFGRYTRKGWTLSVDNQILSLDESGNFTYETPVSRQDMSIQLMAIGPFGEVERQSVTFQFSKWKNQRDDGTGAFAKRLFITPGFSLTSLTHKETNVSDYSTTALTAKVSANYLLFPPRWDLGVTAYLTALQLKKPSQVTLTDSGVSTADVSVHYLGLNLRLGYIFPQLKDPWRLALYSGFYYTTMLVNPKLFGFQNLSGPQLYPSLRRTLKKGDAVVGYVKYSPVSNNFALLNFSNREIAAGAAYIFPRNAQGRGFSTSADYSNIQFGINGISVSTTTLSLGVGYGF